MASFYSNAIFWVDVHKIKPNPYQPRREFDEQKLNDLADSIRQYGVLQPLVVTRNEVYRDDGSMVAEYELIAGERRLRAARIAGIEQVPVVIRDGENQGNVKLELAIIENLQREDLNPIDRAKAFKKLLDDFGYKHTEIAKKVSRSREYVSNSVRLLHLPEEILQALLDRKISEGHARSLLMLSERPEEQQTVFREILIKKLTVRDTEAIARRIAVEKSRKHDRAFNPELLSLEKRASETLGTRVRIAPRGDIGGRILIEFDSDEDLRVIIAMLAEKKQESHETLDADITNIHAQSAFSPEDGVEVIPQEEDIEDDWSLQNFSI